MMTATVVFVLLAVLGQTSSNAGANIALGGKVTQSSVGWNGVPGRASDGNRDGNYWHKSCSHTKHDLNPWWRLDLLKTYKINTVTVTNRKDCCHKRINGAEIRIGNSPAVNGGSRCAVISSIAPGASATFECKELVGRYVTIVIPGRRQYLTLCEVEVTGQLSGDNTPTGTNIALGGKVTQSSVGWNGVPGRASDGNRDGNYWHKSCSHTKHDLNPWWRLDLLKTYKINTVTVTNRKDCCHKRINGAEIRIGNSLAVNGGSRCAVISSIAPGASATFECKELVGRYVTIVIPGRRQYLTLCEVEVTGQLSGDNTPTGTNIALGGKVTQSSVGWNGVPGRASDGNRDGNYWHKSCSHTKHDLNPWWRLDLLKTYKINTVTVTNRKDCCHKRINGAEIRIGNSLAVNGGSRCAVISSIAPGASATFECKELVGRYVTILIPGRRQYLTLCEVEVTGQLSGDNTPTGTNIALGGKVTQSSVGWNGVPGRASDGNRDGNYWHKSCSHTKHDLNPWWRLDLLKTYKINTVTVTNRKDCCHKRINGAEIRIGNSLAVNGGSRCAVISSIAPGASATFECKELVGRYVTILIPGRRQYLTLCEVEVTGQLSGDNTPTGTNIALGGKVTQSSVGWNGVPGRASDGNRDGNYWHKSCSHTKHDLNPWWRLDLLKTYKINTVTVTNRKDCCHKRINGAEIRIGNSLAVNGGSRCAVISSIAPGASATFECKELVGRYVTIVIPGRRQYLTLCEVEVTGQLSGDNTPTGTNIALGGKVTQSSVGWNGVPGRASDGNRDGNYWHKSCSHTKHDLNPWWRLDLLKTYKINTVTVTNRKDCCHKRINGAEILIGNSLAVNGGSRCAVISSIAPGASATFECKELVGLHYWTIVIPGRRQYLTLCEVEVTGQLSGDNTPTGTNIALGGKVTQSSVGWNGVPGRASDGNRDGNYWHKSCSHTKHDLNPWWRLDLLKTYKINTVTVTNRKDCCHKRINDAEIRIGNSPAVNGGSRCAVISSIAPGASATFECKELVGRYVTIVILGRREYLTLCEVEVTGIESDESNEYACG